MRRRLLLGLIVCGLIGASAACTPTPSFPNLEDLDRSPVNSEVVLHIMNAAVTTISFTLENTSSTEYMYGVDYTLFVRRDGSWAAVDQIADLVFPDIGYILAPGATTDPIYLDWERPYGILPAGEYAIQKGLSHHDAAGNPKQSVVRQYFTLP